jgi:hypothetical protein
VRRNPDLVTSKLAALHFYQLAILAPKPPVGSFNLTALTNLLGADGINHNTFVTGWREGVNVRENEDKQRQEAPQSKPESSGKTGKP